MTLEIVVTALATFLLALCLTGVARAFALSHGVLDVPNDRSSHNTPTPSGGGVAIVASTIVAASVLRWRGLLDMPLYLALCGGGLTVAVAGFLDDRRPLPAGIRLAAHFAAALWALFCLGGLPSLYVGHFTVHFGWLGYVLGALGIGWTLNLFNFMDGIDGIAAAEAAFIAWAGTLLAVAGGSCTGACALGLVGGAACCGFLRWNWPPAKIFMGDVGSGFLGYLIGVLAIAGARENAVALLVWLILGGVFFSDASVTLVRRSLRGERVYEAHRTHAYQWLARRWGSHRSVTGAALILNLVWLLPCASVASFYPRLAMWMVLVALAPIVLLALIAGAGRPAAPALHDAQHS